MAVLADAHLRTRINGYGIGAHDRLLPIGITPFNEGQLQPASIDLTLADEWLTYPSPEWPMVHGPAIDIDHAKAVETIKTIDEEYVLMPHELVLCSTVEYVDIPHDLQAQVHGKSSLGRLGLLVHVTAGFIDPGFKGKITLEMYNLNNRPILLRAGKPICQLSLTRLSCPAEFPYGHEKLGSHYQDQTEVTGSRYDG